MFQTSVDRYQWGRINPIICNNYLVNGAKRGALYRFELPMDIR